ncbi:hypothetical protein KC336_g71 [Hortaea werneckii]|nr:hypothetical protein KC336_g71 [Hortaea werneckii]
MFINIHSVYRFFPFLTNSYISATGSIGTCHGVLARLCKLFLVIDNLTVDRLDDLIELAQPVGQIDVHRGVALVDQFNILPAVREEPSPEGETSSNRSEEDLHDEDSDEDDDEVGDGQPELETPVEWHDELHYPPPDMC